jgi:hypothetical protein
MNISIDIDGTISDYPRYWLNFLNAYTMLDFTSTTEARQFLGTKEYERIKLLWREGPENLIPIRDEFKELTHELYKNGCLVFVNSRRPYDQIPSMRKKNIDWLRTQGCKFEDIQVKTNSNLLDQNVEYHIDDEIEEALRIAQLKSIKKVFLLTENRDMSHGEQIYNEHNHKIVLANRFNIKDMLLLQVRRSKNQIE